MKKEILEKKTQLVDELVETFKKIETVVSFDYSGFTVLQLTELRRKLLKEDCKLKIFKNNIARRAAKIVSWDSLADSLTGTKALVYSVNQPIAPAKIVYDFQKQYKKSVIGAGVIQGKQATSKEMEALATIPSREVLLSQLAFGLYMPLRELAVGLNLIEK